jgi:hypothetical protein
MHYGLLWTSYGWLVMTPDRMPFSAPAGTSLSSTASTATAPPAARRSSTSIHPMAPSIRMVQQHETGSPGSRSPTVNSASSRRSCTTDGTPDQRRSPFWLWALQGPRDMSDFSLQGASKQTLIRSLSPFPYTPWHHFENPSDSRPRQIERSGKSRQQTAKEGAMHGRGTIKSFSRPSRRAC